MSIREGSTCTIRARFFNAAKVATLPTSARYRLKDVTNNRIIVDWTNVAPAIYIDVVVSPESNAIYRNTVTYQDNVLIVQADAGLPTQWTDEIRYQVQNLKGYESR